MKRLSVLGAFLLLLSGCAALDATAPTETAAPNQEEAATPSSDLTDGKNHTLAVELEAYQGGSTAARDYVVVQAKQACDALKKELYIDNLASETTWRGGRAEVTFACVEKNDPRLKSE